MTKTPQTTMEDNNSADWKPSQATLQKLTKHGLEMPEIDLLLRKFKEHPDYKKDARNTRFVKFAMLRAGQGLATVTPEQPIPIDWWPSKETIEAVVSRTGITENEISDLVPEFVLYWRERGDLATSWNQKFLQFSEYRASHRIPTPISADWQPSEDAVRLLTLRGMSANQIEIRALEFRLYHRDANTRQLNWQTAFIKWVSRS